MAADVFPSQGTLPHMNSRNSLRKSTTKEHKADAKFFSATKQQYSNFTNSLVNIELFNFHRNRIGRDGGGGVSVAYMSVSAITARMMQTNLNLE